MIRVNDACVNCWSSQDLLQSQKHFYKQEYANENNYHM